MARRELSPAADSSGVALRTLAARLRYAPVERDGTLPAVQRVLVTPEPYQVEAVHRMVSAPRTRFLLADDVGLGKTIQTGLLLAELAARGRARRVLVVVPAALRDQWVAEMAEKFGERFTIYDGPTVKRLRKQLGAGANPWSFHPRVITSLDFLKRERVAAEASTVDWDVVVFDEAHKLGVHQNGGHVARTGRYRVAEALADVAESLVLLTATPHSGDGTAFRGLLALCDPFVEPEGEGVAPAQLRQIMIRRGKGEIRDAKGRPVFTRRRVQTVEVPLRADERALYDGVTEYVRAAYREAREAGDTVGGFAMVLLQRRLCSSVWALRESLRRRVEALRDRPRASSLGAEELARYVAAYGHPEDWDDETLQLATAFEAELEAYARPDADLEDEISTVERLLALADAVLKKGDSKGRALREFADGCLRGDPQGKLLVFTEYQDTLRWCEALLKGHKTWVIHGGVAHADRRRIVAEFNAEGSGILLATDAAGEGLNMQQRCHLMVNVELPWNPNRIDQRIGRLHRYGQRREVRVYNLVAGDTREAAVFELLGQKVQAMEQALGGRVSDVLGGGLRGVKLSDLIMEAIAADESPRVTRRHLEQAIAERQKMLATVEQDFAAALPGFDATRAATLAARTLASRPQSADVREFVLRFAAAHGGALSATRQQGAYALRAPAAGRAPAPARVYFDPAQPAEDAELLHAGHAWVVSAADAVLAGLPREMPEVLGVPGGLAADGLWALFRVRVREAAGGEEAAILPVRVTPDGQAWTGREVALPVAAPAPAPGSIEAARADALLGRADDLLAHASLAAADAVKRLAQQRHEERVHDARPFDAERERYVAAKEAQIAEREAKLRERAVAGEDVTIALRAEDARRRAVRHKAARAKAALDARADVQAKAPELLTWAVLVGVPAANPAAAEPRHTPSGMFPAMA